MPLPGLAVWLFLRYIPKPPAATATAEQCSWIELMVVIVLIGAVVSILIAAQFAKPSTAATFGAFVGIALVGISNGNLPVLLSVAGGAALAAVVNVSAKDW